jgi:hypothetical protein
MIEKNILKKWSNVNYHVPETIPFWKILDLLDLARSTISKENSTQAKVNVMVVRWCRKQKNCMTALETRLVGC